MGTWKLTNFTNVRLWEVGDSWWDVVGSPSLPDLDNQPGNPPPHSTWGEVQILAYQPFYAEFFLDGSATPTTLEDLPDNFGIDSIVYHNTPLWLKDGVTPFVPNFPISANDDTFNIFSGGGAAYWWRLEPIGISEYQTNEGNSGATLTFVDPYAGVGYPPVMTKWNGFLQAFMQGLSFRINFSNMSAQFGSYLLFVFLQQATFGADGYVTGYTFPWEITGTYDVYEPPPNPTVYSMGGLSFGGGATVQALTDASGIYTLIPNQYHDELYQRPTALPATTTEVKIPDPFFKTGYTGD